MNKEQYENTLVLKSVIEDKIAKDEAEFVLNEWFQPCGTYGCVAGDTFLKMFNLKDIYSSDWNTFSDFSTNSDFKDRFGFSMIAGDLNVFGTRIDGTLEERLDYINFKLSFYKEA